MLINLSTKRFKIMKLMARLILVLIFQLNALNALAGMVEMDHSTTDNVTIEEIQNIEPDSHCDAAEGSIDHCHCVVCFAIVDTGVVKSDSGDSQQFFALTKGSRNTYYGIYKPPQ